MTNAFTQFKGLISGGSMDVVTITADNGDRTSQATTLSGSMVTVKGNSVAVNQKAFIKEGQIVRQAPNHSIVQVSI